MQKPKTFMDGESIAHRVGAAVIRITYTTHGGYRVTVSHPSNGLGADIEVPEFTRNWATYEQAAAMARNAVRVFATGATVAKVLADMDAVTVATAAVTATDIVMVPRAELPRPAHATSVRMTAPQLRMLAAALAAGTAEIVRGAGEASVTTLRTLAQAGFADLVTDHDGEVLGARVGPFGWRALAAERARQAGKAAPHMVPVPVAALAAPVTTAVLAGVR